MRTTTRHVPLAAILLIATLTLNTAPSVAQTWSKTYLLAPPDFALPPPESVIEASDGSIYIAGSGIVMKLDPYGNLAWTRQFYAISSGSIPRIVETQDGSLVMAAYLGRAPGRNRFTMIKLDPDGNVVWDVDYGEDTGFRGRSWGVEEAPDGSLFLWGDGSDGDPNTDLWLMKTDALGNPTWQKRYGGPAAESVNVNGINIKNFAILSNGHLVLAGQTQSWGPYSTTASNLWVVFLDSNGNILSQNVYGGEGNTDDFGSSVTVTSSPDTRVLLVAGTHSFVAGSFAYSIWVLELDLSGNLISQNAYGGGSMFAGLMGEVFATADGNLAILVDFNSPVLVRLSSSGSATGEQLSLAGWNYSFNYPRAMGYADDGGFLIATRGYWPTTGDAGTWMLRTDASGGVADSCDVTADAFPITGLATDTVPIDTDAVAADLNLPLERNPPDDPHNPPWYRFISLSTADQCGLAVPRIEAVPWRLDFGLVGTSQTATMPIEIRSTGELDLYVSAMDASPPFGVATSCVGSTVPAGGACVAEIEFNPPYVGAFNGELTVESDDPATPVLMVPLAGEGTNLIFEDDFESGDTSAWSASVP